MALAAKEVPVFRIYVGILSNSIAMRVNDIYYDARATVDKYIYEVELTNCTKKGLYYADILNGSDVLSENNLFEITKKGMAEVSLFD